MAGINILSLNCHGFSASTVLYLHRICNNYDVILLQETWLSNANCHKISDVLPDFSMYHNSAMENRLSSSIRRGRPYGGTGTAVLIRSSICKSHQLLMSCPDICGVKCVLGGGQCIVLCSVYMPYDSGDRLLQFEAVIGDMQSLVDKCLGFKFVFGGDFNLSKHNPGCEDDCVKNFCVNNNFLWPDVHADCVTYTYHNDKLQRLINSPELIREQNCVRILRDHGWGQFIGSSCNFLCVLCQWFIIIFSEVFCLSDLYD